MWKNNDSVFCHSLHKFIHNTLNIVDRADLSEHFQLLNFHKRRIIVSEIWYIEHNDGLVES